VTLPSASLNEANWLAGFRHTDAIEASNPAAADAWREAIDAIEHAQRMVKRAEDAEVLR
jgi:hypothetical protein